MIELEKKIAKIGELVFKECGASVDQVVRVESMIKTLCKEYAMEIVGADDKDVRGITQNPKNPNYHTKRTKHRNQLRAEQIQAIERKK